ncbi:MAG: phenylacetate--CoA ligase family protein [Chloroflexi bacterium]|nr:phenylacetate--CoA ligase family protein [Chloroflexota bacterium]
MSDSEYWNPKIETLPREDLQRLQLLKLQRLVDWGYAKSPFLKRKYDQAGFKPEQLKSLDDIRRIPFIERQEWLDEQKRHPLFGETLTAGQDEAIRYHSTSGTSGATPLRVLDGTKDWQWISEMWALGFWAFGVRPTDTVYFAFSYGSFIGFWGAHYCCEKLGALTIASGGQTTEGRVKQIEELGVTTVCATPTYVLRLQQVASELGIDLRKTQVNKVIMSGEPAGSIPAVKRMIEDVWGAKSADTAGMTEIGTIMIFECSHQPGGTHIIEDHFIEEVLEPGSDRSLGYGEKGERVVTSFGRGFIPLIRYRTGDLVEKVPYSECSCGRTYDIYKGGIIGRADDMKLIRGTNVFPSAVEAIVREHSEIDEFQIVLTKAENLIDEITVRCELKTGSDGAWSQLQPALSRELADGHEGLRFNVERAGAGELPRFELKAKRLVDQREWKIPQEAR